MAQSMFQVLKSQVSSHPSSLPKIVCLSHLLFQLKFWNHLVMLQITYVCYIYKQILEELFLCEQILKTQICFKMTTV